MTKWVTNAPEAPGFYWVKVGPRNHVVEVVESHQISGLGVRLEGYIVLPVPLFCVEAWAGPIEEPEA